MVVAGFPSPADDYIEAGVDLNLLLIPHPISTFLWRVSGEAMQGAGIHDGDLLLVDRSLQPRPRKSGGGYMGRGFHFETLRAFSWWLAFASGPSRLSPHRSR